MKLNVETLTFRDTVLEFRELTMKDFVPLMTTMSEDAIQGQLELLKSCVYVDGERVGEAIEDWPASLLRQAVPIAMRVNEMSAEGNGENSGQQDSGSTTSPPQ